MILDWVKAILGYGVRYVIRFVLGLIVLTVFLFIMSRLGML